jgi:hypothetical protein
MTTTFPGFGAPEHDDHHWAVLRTADAGDHRHFLYFVEF